jgi:hypothetical protein
VIAKELGTEDMTLYMWWIRSGMLAGSEWYDNDELSLYHYRWDAEWNGRFRSMKITVTMEGSPMFEWGDETPKMTKETEDFAKRLVGKEAELVRFEHPASS